MQLGDFTERFLCYQGLEGFSLVFVPEGRGKASRRKKKQTALIYPLAAPETGSLVSGTKKVADLLARFHKLAGTGEWVTGHPAYALKLLDLQKEPVKGDVDLSVARKREDVRKQRAFDKAYRVLGAALRQCERELEVDEIRSVFDHLMESRA